MRQSTLLRNLQRSSIFFSWICLASVLCFFSACKSSQSSPDPENIAPHTGYEAVAERLSAAIAQQMTDKELSAVSIALVAGDTLIWSHGFGLADPKRKTPAGGGTVYRIASLSKLFTAIGVMQLQEQGKLDIDAPVNTYLPGFHPENPFDKPITLRQMMSHRSGLVREPPVGHYFDPTEPSLEELVTSLNRTRLVYQPETRTKYSNAAVSVAGLALAKVAEHPFTEHMRQKVLTPIGMTRSDYTPLPEVSARLATGYMWTYEGRVFPAPTFQLGMVPAAGMYATVNDLGQFMKMLIRHGQGENGQLLQPETLEKMWQIQYADAGQQYGFGLGFYVSKFHEYRQVRHGGVMYGYATQIAVLPEARLGAVTIITNDCANIVAGRINDYAFELLLAKQAGKPLPEFRIPAPPDSQAVQALAGSYHSGEEIVDLEARDGRLYAFYANERNRLMQFGDTLLLDDRLSYGHSFLPQADGSLLIDGTRFQRRPEMLPPPPPPRWEGLIGEYGWDHNTLYILEKHGRLYALIEWFFFYPLEEISPDVYAFPDYGLYHGEQLIFTRDEQGIATQVEAASVVFRRRPAGLSGDTFRIDPQQPLETLRAAALKARPPAESGDFLTPDLVEVQSLDSTIHLDIRYATTNNFMGAQFYDQPRAFLQRPAAEALLGVERRLQAQGYGLLIHDAYRPWYVTKMFWDATPENQKIFVANPKHGSRHNRGCAVDLTLYTLADGRPVEMVSGYDEFTDRAYPEYPGGTSQQRYHRELLRRAMEAEGFANYPAEWWHYDYHNWRRYPILNQQFSELGLD